MKEAKNDAKRLLRLPPKVAVRAGLMPAEGNDAYLNVANSAVDNDSTPREPLPRIPTNDCALHHISENRDRVVIRMDENDGLHATIDVPPQSPCCPFQRHSLI